MLGKYVGCLDKFAIYGDVFIFSSEKSVIAGVLLG